MNKNQKRELQQLSEEDVKFLTASLLNQKITAIQRLEGGKNNQIYLLSGKQNYVAKVYFRDSFDLRNRLYAEYQSLKFLWDNGIRSIPQPLAQDPEKNLGIYGFIEGTKIASKDISLKELNAATLFLKEINKLQSKAEKLLLASDACFCTKDYFNIVARRLEDLSKVPESSSAEKELHLFLREEFQPFFQKIFSVTETLIRQEGLSIETEITKNQKILSPSDFGFHNALQDKDQNIIFLDFEYFGWDDSAKTISDFLLHPGMQLSEKHKKYFAQKMFDSLNEGKIRQRVKITYPLVGLIWCLIILNEFVPRHQIRREFAVNQGDLNKKAQLEKAKQLLNSLKEYKTTYWEENFN